MQLFKKTSKIDTKIRDWCELPYGFALKEALESKLDKKLKNKTGFYLLQLGNLSCNLHKFTSKIRYQFSVGEDSTNATLRSRLDLLPLREKSIDIVILAHQLDFEKEPHNILREIERVLMFDGEIVIVGFNPFSWLGLIQILKQQRLTNFHLPTRVMDWLHLLGFEILSCDLYNYKNLKKEVNLLDLSNYKQSLRLISPFNHQYIIVAKKCTYPLRALPSSWEMQLAPIRTNLKLNPINNTPIARKKIEKEN